MDEEISKTQRVLSRSVLFRWGGVEILELFVSLDGLSVGEPSVEEHDGSA